MTRDEVAKSVIQVLADTTGKNIEELHENLMVKRDLSMDSIDFVDFIFDIEDELGIFMPDEIADAERTVKEVIDAAYERVREAETWL